MFIGSRRPCTWQIQLLAMKVSSLNTISSTRLKVENNLNILTKYPAGVCYIHYYVISFRSDATVYSFVRISHLLARVLYKNPPQIFYWNLYLSSHLAVYEMLYKLVQLDWRVWSTVKNSIVLSEDLLWFPIPVWFLRSNN